MLTELRATDLSFNRNLGLRDAPPGSNHLLELPFTPLLHNHLGTMHATAQFALAEAASAECLQRSYGAAVGEVFAVVREAVLKFRHPAKGDLLAFARPDDMTRDTFLSSLATQGCARAVILVDLNDRVGNLSYHGRFAWFISRVPPPVS